MALQLLCFFFSFLITAVDSGRDGLPDLTSCGYL